MPYTEEQRQAFKNQFRTRRRTQLIATAFAVIPFFLMATADQDTDLVLGFIPVSIFFVIFLMALIALVVFSLKNWRCPACNGYLGRKASPKSCPRCGVELQ